MSEQVETWRVAPGPALRRIERLKRWARVRPKIVWPVLLAPAVFSVLVDWWQRGERMAEFAPRHVATYAATWGLAATVWAVLLAVSTSPNRVVRRVGAGWFLFAFTFALGGQTYFYRQYNAYLTRDLSLFAANLLDSVVNQLWADAPGYLSAKLPFFVLGIALLIATRWVLRLPRRWGRRLAWAAAPVFLFSCVVPTQHRQRQAAVPEVLYFNSLGAFAASQFGLTEQSRQVRPRVRSSLPVPALLAAPERERNVLLVIAESVRADAACSRFERDCRLTPFTNQLLPERHALTQLRAVDSTTAISLAVLWSGLAPQEDSERLHTWPLLFDYANAAGWDTAFWTSQNLMFGNSRLWVKNLGARLNVSATRLDPNADLDMGADEAALAAHVERELSELREPFFATIQLSNVHYPYFVHEERPMPFQPSEFDKSEEGNHKFRNYYQNAVVQQDEHLAQMITALRRTEAGKRTVIVYTSDHGEAFREHYQMGHTFTLFDEEIKVPGFVDAPAGTLSEFEREHLKSKESTYTFHVDVTPTILDLMGLWDAPALAPFREPMLGTSWLRPEVTEATVPMTNCAAVWSCAFENWGVMKGSLKAFARTPYATGWNCFDVNTDPLERAKLGTKPCRELQQEALQIFGRMPY